MYTTVFAVVVIIRDACATLPWAVLCAIRTALGCAVHDVVQGFITAMEDRLRSK